MMGHRQAAVALHALGDIDRGLILEQLPAADQSLLRGYLAELTALGFEPDQGAPSVLPNIPAPHPELALASAVDVFNLLEHEPVALVAEVLAQQPWRWSADLLDLFHPAKREAISAIEVQAAPARSRFVIASLNARLAQAAVPSSPFKMLWQRVKSWRS